MKLKATLLVAVVIVAAVLACGGDTSSRSTKSPVPIDTSTKVPIVTILPPRTLTSSSVPTSTPSLPTSINRQSNELASLVSTVQATELVRLGKGTLEYLDWSPDGKHLIVVSSIGIYLYDAHTMQQVKFIDSLGSTLIYTHGQALIVEGDTTIKLRDVVSKNEIVTLAGHTDIVSHVMYSPDGNNLVTTSRDGTVRLWDAKTGRELWMNIFAEDQDMVRYIKFSPDGQMLGAIGFNGDVIVWDVKTGDELKFIGRFYNSLNLEAADFSPDLQILAKSNLDGTVKLWDVASESELKTLTGGAEGFGSFAFSSDGQTLAWAGDEAVTLWNVTTGGELNTIYKDKVIDLLFSPDGKTLATRLGHDEVILWDVASGRELNRLTDHIYRGLNYESNASFTSDGQILAFAAFDGGVTLWNVVDGRELKTLADPTSSVEHISLSPDDRILALVDYGKIQLWNVASGRELMTLTGYEYGEHSMSFSPDGRLLASGANDDTTSFEDVIKLWNVESGQEVKIFTGHTEFLNSLTFSPDGRLLASAADDNTIKLWDVASGRELKTLTGHLSNPSAYRSGVNSVSFSPDGRLLASAADDNTIKLWDVASGRELKTLTGHIDAVKSFGRDESTNGVNWVSFSPDGRLLASAADDNTIKLWDVASGQELKTLTGHTSSVRTVTFSSNGKALASTSWDGTVRIWSVGEQ